MFENWNGAVVILLLFPLISKDNVVSKFANENMHTKLANSIKPIEGMPIAVLKACKSNRLRAAEALSMVRDSGSLKIARQRAHAERTAAT